MVRKSSATNHPYSTSMAASKLLIASLFFSLFFLWLVFEADADRVVNSYTTSEPMPYEQNKVNSYTPSEPMPAGKIDCAGACKARCRLASRQNLCHRACGTCCARCSCVPPGTSGNQDVCPCYASLTTHGGRKKCP